ncbi:DMT family transporter [Mesorhizobium australicum]|uniref:Threonine/homoserine efflux transporter RhtA n=1 Tax=Mesorhizobium australicum TaxID=536018 RepID=A0A1X7NF53_9HYPH|nr:DMT family transporter [Mesorhizobium australicum]SMH35939.1 Threonine/homoserine efflux transporter RhtA [Mesorhizobium australicum]
MSNASTAGAARHDSDRATRLGIAFMLLAILMFALNDTLGKWLLGSYGVGQLLFIRTVSALLVMVPILMRVGWRSLFPASRGWLLAARALIATLEIGAFYVAVSYLPLADTITYWMAAPIYVAALSPFLLGEHVGWRRWTAIIVGFVGVLIALNPSAETLTLPALVSIGGSLLFTLLMITGRALRGTPDAAMVFWPLVTSGIAGAMTIPFAWTPPALDDLALLALLGIVALGAHYFTNRSLALADASTVTPYQYTLLVWAMLFGWLFFGEVPKANVLVGGAVIVAAGLYIFFRERRLGRTNTADPSAGSVA